MSKDVTYLAFQWIEHDQCGGSGLTTAAGELIGGALVTTSASYIG